MKNETLKKNFESLIRTMDKHGEKLSKLYLGKELYSFVFSNYYHTRQLNSCNKYGVPLLMDTKVGKNEYKMFFEGSIDSEVGVSMTTLKAPKEVCVGKAVTIFEESSSKVKQNLKSYVGLVGNCILLLKNQEQYVVEFPGGHTVAFPIVNVKPILNLEMVSDISVMEVYSGGQSYKSIVLEEDSSKNDIESYLKTQVGKVDAVVITKRYFLTEL